MRAMTTVADWHLAQRLDVEPDGRPRALTDWTNGVLYTGVMALARIASDDRYFQAMRRIGDQVRRTTTASPRCSLKCIWNSVSRT